MQNKKVMVVYFENFFTATVFSYYIKYIVVLVLNVLYINLTMYTQLTMYAYYANILCL